MKETIPVDYKQPIVAAATAATVVGAAALLLSRVHSMRHEAHHRSIRAFEVEITSLSRRADTSDRVAEAAKDNETKALARVHELFGCVDKKETRIKELEDVILRMEREKSATRVAMQDEMSRAAEYIASLKADHGRALEDSAEQFRQSQWALQLAKKEMEGKIQEILKLRIENESLKVNTTTDRRRVRSELVRVVHSALPDLAEEPFCNFDDVATESSFTPRQSPHYSDDLTKPFSEAQKREVSQR